jgi:hypothetical protein
MPMRRGVWGKMFVAGEGCKLPRGNMLCSVLKGSRASQQENVKAMTIRELSHSMH